MKIQSTLTIFFLAIAPITGSSQAVTQANVDALFTRFYTIVNPASGHRLVTPSTYNAIIRDVFTKQAPDLAGDVKSGSAFTLNIDDDKTSASAKGSIMIGDASLLNLGFKSAIDNNVGEVFSGKSGFNTDWGVNLGYTRRLWSSMSYNASVRPKMHAKRNLYLRELYHQYMSYYGATVNMATYTIPALGDIAQINTDINSGGLRATTDVNYAGYTTSVDQYLIADSINHDYEEFFEEKLIAWERAAASWVGYNLLFFNGRLEYNNNGYTRYNLHTPIISDRFEDIQFSQWKLNAGLSFVHNGPRIYFYADGSIYMGNSSTFELPQNKKYLISYNTEVMKEGSGNDTLQYSVKNKKAFDSSLLDYKSFQKTGLDLQLTAFFGKSKTFGLNLATNYSVSTLSDSKSRLDIGFGPVISINGSEKESVAKTNFGLSIGFQDLSNNTLNTSEKFSARFFVNIPVRIFNFGD